MSTTNRMQTTPGALAARLTPRPEVVFMDCDGVIFDSNLAKCRAYEIALAEYPADAVAELVAWHQATGGISRFVKLERFFREMCPVADPDAAKAGALARFSDASVAAYRELVPRPEALAFARALGGPERVFVVSGGAQVELAQVFADAGVADVFAAILGSPVTKDVHMTSVLTARGVAPERALLVGDGRGDWEAAAKVGVPFVYLAEMSEWQAAPDLLGPDVAVAARWVDLLAAAGL
ncbi:MAG: HAD family hydrolase [Deltaproteobacteria bacterium]|nr:HAD family hydrolase [Deltaproteobacteria bacterium]